MEIYFREEKIGRDLTFSENFRNYLIHNIADIHEKINYGYYHNEDGYLFINQKITKKTNDKEINIYEFEVKYDDSLYMVVEVRETKTSKIRTIFEIITRIYLEELKTYNIIYIEKEEEMYNKITEIYDFLKNKIRRFNEEYENERKLEREFTHMNLLSSLV